MSTYPKPEDMSREELIREVHELRKAVGASQIAMRHYREQERYAKVRRRWTTWEP